MMKVEFQSKKLISSLNTGCKEGSFALDGLPLTFETCRERFAAAFHAATSGFFFKHLPEQSKDVAAFLLKTEEILGLEASSNFAETTQNTIVWVEPNSFWKVCPMRRSLLTIFLRAGILYSVDRDNYEDALFGQEYVIPTRKAVMRFLFGFTDYTGPDITAHGSIQVRGWKAIFEGKGEEEIRSLLVCKGEVDRHYSPDFAKALWN